MLGVSAAKPQSDKWGFNSSSSKIFADFKFLCTTEGRQTSCKYLPRKRASDKARKIENYYKKYILYVVMYSRARAVPSATLTRAFHVKVLVLSSAKCSKSCKLPFAM